MLRKYIFSEELGRNIIWIMLSGFFLKIGAKENFFGQIVMPKNHYLFNLDDKKINKDYLNYKHLHYIFLDGSIEFLKDKKYQNIKKKTNIYYVGKLDVFWKNIQKSQPLFSDDISEIEENIIEIKKKFPIFFKKYFFKKLITTVINIRKFKLWFNHVFGKKKFVYYGYIKPTKKHLEEYQKYLGINKYKFNIFFDKITNKKDLIEKINQICFIKHDILKDLEQKHYPFLNEFLLFMIRNLICNIFKDKKNFLIHDGLGGDYNFNAYETLFGNQHTYLDLGSKVGFDKIYPRKALLKLFKRNIVSFNLQESLFFLKTNHESNIYLYKCIDEFLNKLNIKL